MDRRQFLQGLFGAGLATMLDGEKIGPAEFFKQDPPSVTNNYVTFGAVLVLPGQLTDTTLNQAKAQLKQRMEMQHQASALEVPEDYHVRFEYIINEPEVTPEDPLAQRAAIAIKWKIPGDFLKGNDIEGGDDGQLIIGPSGEPKPFRYG